MMSKTPISWLKLILFPFRLIGISLACNLPKASYLDELAQKGSADEFTRDEVAEFFERAEGERSYTVDEGTQNIDDDCDLDYPMGDSVPVRIDHFPG